MRLLGELQRRNVIRMAGLYLVMAWLLVQVAGTVLPMFEVPGWVARALVIVLALGFVPTLVFAWIFELTPEGLRRDAEVPAEQSIAPQTARRMDRLIVVGLLLVIGLMAVERFWPADTVSKPGTQQAPRVVVANPAVSAAIAIEIPARSVAVLPFANRSAEADTAYFVDGVHDDLITRLARNAQLKVISRTSVMEYRDTTRNLRQIGRELGVATVIEGAVQRAGNRVRINAQLIDTATDKHLWAETFDRELTPENIFEIQTDIARAIAAALAQTLGEAHAAPVVATASAPTQDREAYDLYLQARALDYATVFNTEPSERGAELYRRAIARDPKFALAMGELGHQLTNIYWFGARDPAQRDEARLWIDRALALAPDEPWLHWILADHLYHGRLDYDGALRELEIAERGLPNGARIFDLRGWILRRRGNMDAALRSMESAVALDPRSVNTIVEIINTNIYRDDLRAVRLWSARLKAIPSASAADLRVPAWAEFQLLGDTAPIREFIAWNQGTDAFNTRQAIRIAYVERRYIDAVALIATVPETLLVEQGRAIPPELLHAFVLRAQGKSAEMQKRAAIALAKLDDFLTSHPDDGSAVVSRAMALAMLGRLEEARRTARSTVELEESQGDVLRGLGFLANELIVLGMTATSEELAAAMASYLALEYKFQYFDSIMLDPVFDAHRDHPAMRELARRYSRKPASP